MTIQTYDEAIGYLLRDPQSVEAECARAIGDEVKRLREEHQVDVKVMADAVDEDIALSSAHEALKAKLARVDALIEGIDEHVSMSDPKSPVIATFKVVLTDLRVAMKDKP